MQFKRFKLGVFLVIALMFLFLGTRVYEAGAQAPLCPQVQLSNGWLSMDLLDPIPDPGVFVPTFSEGLLGTFELLDNNALVGDLDWMYDNEGSDSNNTGEGVGCRGDTATTCVGSQVIGWWSQKNGRNTHVHFTNTAQVIDHVNQIGRANIHRIVNFQML